MPRGAARRSLLGAAAGLAFSWSAPSDAAERTPRVRLAPGTTIAIPGGHKAISSLIGTGGPMAYGDFAWSEVRGSGALWMRVDLSRQLISVFRGGDEIGTAVILYGSDGRSTPRGAFRVLERDRDHRSSLYDVPMPFMLRLTMDGVAIHASDVRSGRATHGCVGVPSRFAGLLFATARVGTPVYIV